MFEIHVEQRQYRTYILSDRSTQSCLEIVPERGGIVTRWQLQGQEWLYLDQERYTNPQLTVRGGIPILFPICGNLPDNTYHYKGQAYTLKQHGFARDLPWTVIRESSSAAEASLTLRLESNEQTRAIYPFDFQVEFTYLWRGHELEIQQIYTNASTETMPFSTGFHPYFTVNDKSKLQFQIPATEAWSNLSQGQESFSGEFDFTADEIDLAFPQLTAQTSSVVDKKTQQKLTLSYDSLFSTLVFWTLKNKPFYCLEPWSAPRNALNTGKNLLQLEPGTSLETWIRIHINLSI